MASAVSTEVRRALNKRVVAMYRQMARDVPRVVVMYELQATVAEIRHVLLLLFRKNQHVSDPRVIEMLLAHAKMEHQETMEQWKQRAGLIDILTPQQTEPDAWLDEEEFFRKFLDGTLDESQVFAGFDKRKMESRLAAARAVADATTDKAGEAERVRALLAGLAKGETTKARLK